MDKEFIEKVESYIKTVYENGEEISHILINPEKSKEVLEWYDNFTFHEVPAVNAHIKNGIKLLEDPEVPTISFVTRKEAMRQWMISHFEGNGVLGYIKNNDIPIDLSYDFLEKVLAVEIVINAKESRPSILRI